MVLKMSFCKILKKWDSTFVGSREVANLTEIKNLHTPVYGVKEFVCLSVVKLPRLAPFAGGVKNLQHKFFLYLILLSFKAVDLIKHVPV